MKKEKGITLIALIITIVVLLILSGIVISQLTGNENMMNSAGTAVQKYNSQQEIEDSSLSSAQGYLEEYMPNGENGGGNPEEDDDDDTLEPEVDKTPPTVTAKQESVTITEGKKYLLSEYFTVVPNVTTEGVQIVYTINGEEYEDTENLTATGSPYTVICTASKNGGNTNSSNVTIVVEPSWKVTITANQETLEITQEDNNTFESLFTITTVDGGTATKTYTLNGEATNYTNTSELPVGTHTVTCTATYNGASESASTTIIVNAPRLEYTKLEYTTPGTYTWTVPEGVTTIKVTVAGAGGGGRRSL